MDEKYQNRYRIASTRLQNWEYGWNAAYFVTICTKRRHHYFGDIVDGQMNLSAIGLLADVFFYEIINHGKNIELDTFVVMPNHVHGILVIKNNDAGAGDTAGRNS
jgi:REP element-mobilizing transposase RayT